MVLDVQTRREEMSRQYGIPKTSGRHVKHLVYFALLLYINSDGLVEEADVQYGTNHIRYSIEVQVLESAMAMRVPVI